MLIGNYTALHKMPLFYMASTSGSDVRSNYNKAANSRNAENSLGLSNKSGIPNGTRPPYSWIIAQKAGGLSSYNTIYGTGSIASAIPLPTRSAIVGQGSFNPNPSLAGVLNAVAALLGSGSFASNPTLGAIISKIATLTGTGSIQSALLRADAMMSALITPLTPLSPQTLAAAVWDAILAQHLTAGTTGNALNAAGAAGDPWSTTLPGTYTGNQAGAIMQGLKNNTGLIPALL